jgi:hypothetical protein
MQQGRRSHSYWARERARLDDCAFVVNYAIAKQLGTIGSRRKR